MSPVPCACAAVVLRYCQLRAASSMAADRYMGDRWWVRDGRLDCDRADLSRIRARMCRVLSRDGSVTETFCKIYRGGESKIVCVQVRQYGGSKRAVTKTHPPPGCTGR